FEVGAKSVYACRHTLPERTSERARLMSTLHGYRGTLLDYVADPNSNAAAVRLEEDGLLLVGDGKIRGRGAYRELAAAHPDITVVDYRGKLLVPGFVDGHVHYPQTEMIAAYGEQLLEWLERYTFPAERRFRD